MIFWNDKIIHDMKIRYMNIWGQRGSTRNKNKI